MKRLTSFFYIFLMLFSLGHAQSWVDSSPMSCDELQGQIESDGTNLFYLTIERNTFELKLQTFDGSQWQAFGSPTFNSLQIVGEKPVLSMKGSTPYIFYVDASGDLNVIYYDGRSWQYLGGQDFHSPQGTIARVSFDASGNQPYLSYIDSRDNFQVKVWTYDGSSWQNLPAAGQASISFTCIRTSGSTPYLAFLGRPPFNTLSFVKKYNGSAWVDVGLPLFATGSGSKCINFYNGEPYILLYDRANNALPTVKKFDGSNWVNIGPAGFSAVNPDGGRIIFDGATPYVNLSRGNGQSEVRKFDGTNWLTVGTFPVPNANVDFCQVGSDFYVAYYLFDRATFTGVRGIRRFDPSGTLNPLHGPTATCQDITVSLDPSGNNSLAVSQIDNGSSDACTIKSMILSPSTFDCQNKSFPVNLTVSNLRSISSSCTATVTVHGASLADLSPQGCNNCGEIRATICQYDQAPDLEALVKANPTYLQGSTLQWYADNQGSLGASLNSTPGVNTNQTGNSYYWVAQQDGAGPCSSTSNPIRLRVRVKKTFTPDFNLPTIACAGAGQINLAAWVSDPKSKASAYTFFDVNPEIYPNAVPLGSATANQGVVNYGQTVTVSVANGSQTYWVRSTVPNGCGGLTSSTLVANAQTASLNHINNLSVQHGDPVNLAFSGANATYFVWFDLSQFNNPNIGLLGSSGLGNLSFTAYNVGSNPISATIRVVAYNGNCAGQSQDVSITVNPGAPSRLGKANRLVVGATLVSPSTALIHWDMVYEQELLRFEVEKKQPSGAFEAIGMHNWQGNGAYQYKDINLDQGTQIYRLKMVHVDGRVSWSKEIHLPQALLLSDSFKAFPNPTHDELFLKAHFELTASHTYQLIDGMGKIQLSGEMEQQLLKLSLEGLPEGIYYLRINSQKGQQELIKVFKR